MGGLRSAVPLCPKRGTGGTLSLIRFPWDRGQLTMHTFLEAYRN